MRGVAGVQELHAVREHRRSSICRTVRTSILIRFLGAGDRSHSATPELLQLLNSYLPGFLNSKMPYRIASVRYASQIRAMVAAKTRFRRPGSNKKDLYP